MRRSRRSSRFRHSKKRKFSRSYRRGFKKFKRTKKWKRANKRSTLRGGLVTRDRAVGKFNWFATGEIGPGGAPSGEYYGISIPLNGLNLTATGYTSTNAQMTAPSYKVPNFTQELRKRYAYYIVKASKIKIRIIGANYLYTSTGEGTSTTPNTPVSMTIVPADTNITTYTAPPGGSGNDADLIAQQLYARTKLINFMNTGPPFKMSHYMPVTKLEGIPKVRVMVDPQYQALTNNDASLPANPTNPCTWHIVLSRADHGTIGTTSPTYLMQIKVTQYVEFFRRVSNQVSNF